MEPVDYGMWTSQTGGYKFGVGGLRYFISHGEFEELAQFGRNWIIWHCMGVQV